LKNKQKNKNGWSQELNGKGERVVFNGFCWKHLLPGDLIIRPVVPRRNPFFRWIDHLLNRLIPLSLGHIMMYVGEGRVVNIRPDKKPVVSIEPVIANFSEFGIIRRNPNLLHIIRINTNKNTRKNLVRFFIEHSVKDVRFKHIFRPAKRKVISKSNLYDGFNCVWAIRLAFRESGFPETFFKPVTAASADVNWLQRCFSRHFFSGYNFFQAADVIIQPEKLH